MRVARFSGVCALAIYLVLHLLYPTIVSEVFLYNLIPIASIIGISVAPHISDRFAKPSMASAVVFWAVASTVGSIAIFYSTSTTSSFVSNLFYLLFYPLAIIGLPRLLATNRKISVIELVDSSIFGLGLSTLGSALIAKPLVPHFDGNIGKTFFAVTFPIADLILVCVIIATVSMQGFSRHGCTTS